MIQIETDSFFTMASSFFSGVDENETKCQMNRLIPTDEFKEIEKLIYYVSGEHVKDIVCLGPPSPIASRSDTLERMIIKAKEEVKKLKGE